ncbi:MAG: nucleotide exchange factor GrpE [Nitrosopumilus sp.]|nr:nucleotide exchange factor GrpE [Nitrosopumilus sp.]MDH3501815.1 nucleotide exchange factor GrpE [Nitrosopumilus sp.]
MSEEKNSEEIPIHVISDDEENNFELNTKNSQKLSTDELENLLALEQQKVFDYEEKIKHVLADYQNLNRKTQSDIAKGVNSKIDEFMLEFLKIYDDFVRAKEIFSQSKIDTAGLNSILKNMDSLLAKYNVTPIDALGEIFDPNLHEAISIITDPELDENTITKEIRKGYISHERVIRPTLVEITKKDEMKYG